MVTHTLTCGKVICILAPLVGTMQPQLAPNIFSHNFLGKMNLRTLKKKKRISLLTWHKQGFHPLLLANTGFCKVSFIHHFRIEISDHGASEGSDDTLPNETTVKFINEVSSKVSHLLVLRGYQSWSRKFFWNCLLTKCLTYHTVMKVTENLPAH